MRETFARSLNLKLQKKLQKQTTNAVYNLTIGKAINATVYKVRFLLLSVFQEC